MSDKSLLKFFDPKTLPKPELKSVAIDYFLKVRAKLRLDFSLSEAPDAIYLWDDEKSVSLLKNYQDRGGKEVLVDAILYEKKIKEMANS